MSMTDERPYQPRPATPVTTIIGFHSDSDGAWVADLACGHSQHVRHRPPWESRPWTLTEAGRAAKLGAAIECPLCAPPGRTAAATLTG